MTTLRWCARCGHHLPTEHEHAPSLFDPPVLDLAPGRVRTDDYPTSRAGAASVAYRAGSQKARLLAAYRAAPGGLTDDEAARAAGIPEHACYWKRCGELRDAGLIVATGATRPGQVGVPRIVCRIAEAMSA